jgi:hypothetical protein
VSDIEGLVHLHSSGYQPKNPGDRRTPPPTTGSGVIKPAPAKNLRDEFAMMAFNALIARGYQGSPEAIAEASYAHADALLSCREEAL